MTVAGDGSNGWVLTRADDYEATAKIHAGDRVGVNEGTVYGDTLFVLATDDPITLDTTPLVFTRYTGLYPSTPLYKETVAAGVIGPVTITHNLNTTTVSVEVIRVSDGATVYVDGSRPDANTVVIDFVGTLTDSFTVIVRAA